MRAANLVNGWGHTSLPEFLRLAGFPQDQPELPWWVDSILDWLLRVRAIGEAYGEAGEAARYKLEVALERQPIRGYAQGPEAVYEIYRTMLEAQQAEKNSQ